MQSFKQYLKEQNLEEDWKSVVAGGLLAGSSLFSQAGEADKKPATSEIQMKKAENFDNILSLILKHEGLLPKQTPFRITNNTMKKWDTIHGFKIDKSANIPENRKNFIFLQNPTDVPKAVKKQFYNYATNPTKYGLPKTVTLKDALLKFDQTGAMGKMKYLLTKLPDLDLDQPLINLLS